MPDISSNGQKIVYSIHYSPSRVRETDPDGRSQSWTLTERTLQSSQNRRRHHEQSPPRYDIYVMNADGSGKRQLTFVKPGEVYANPSFSCAEPNKILCIPSEGLSSHFDLGMMDANGENERLVLEHSDELLAINDFMFSPDDKTIIFEAKIREDQNGNRIYNMFTVNSTGGDLTRITADDEESDVLPQFSPDGKRIAYFTYVFENSGNTHRIRVADAGGTEETAVSTYPWESDPRLVP